MFEQWKAAVMSPKETFPKELKKPSMGTALKWAFIGGAIGGFVSGLISGVFGLLFRPNVSGIISLVTGPIFGAIMMAIFAPIALIICTGILFLLAKLFGGKGSFTTHTYINSMFMSPLMIVSSVSAIPLVGILISFAVGIYQLYLEVLAVKAVHGLDTTKAVLVVLIPVIIAIIIAVLVAAVIVAALAAMGMSGFWRGY